MPDAPIPPKLPKLTREWLQGKAALVTGASRGLGLGIVETFLDAGAVVLINALTEERLSRVVQELSMAHPQRVFGLAGDASNWDGAQKVVLDAIKTAGKIDILVNTVGDAIPRKLVTDEELQAETLGPDFGVEQIMGLNLMSAIYCTRAIGPHMIRRKSGRVISLASVMGGLRGHDRSSLYAASKSGLIGFMRSIAREWAQHGITVNTIAPGVLPDPGNFSQDVFDKLESTWAPRIPLGRLGDIREIGPLALYLASDQAAYLTGQTIAFDGGLSA